MADAGLPWWEWTCHTNFSFLTGASHPEDCVQRAHDLGYRGLGITDYDGVYGIVRAWRRQQEWPEPQKLPLFHGCEMHLAADHQRPVVYRDSVILLALNRSGYRQMNELISFAHRDSKDRAVLPLDHLLAKASPDLICLQPMRGLIRREPMARVQERYQSLRDAFGDNFFLLISRHLNPAEDHWIPLTLELSRRLDIPWLCSQDAFFHEEKAKELCDILQAIRLNQTVDEVIPHLFVNRERCLHPPALLYQRYQALPGFQEALRRAAALAERFHFHPGELCYQYPQEMLPPGHTAQSYLEEITWEAARQRYPAGIPDTVLNTLQKELNLSAQLNIADYFLTVWQIVSWARSQNILCQGRGSAANSAICYVLNITAVNPERFDLLFERFLCAERGEPPDIDVDFEHERREEVIQHIYERYGRHRAAMVANVIAFRSRSALRMVGKALGIPMAIIQDVNLLQERRLQRLDKAPTLAEGESSGWGDPTVNASLPVDLWFDLAQRIKGFPQHMGIHSGGFILNHEDMTSIVPVEPATMEGRTVVQWSKEDIEALNIFKIDVLALGMLTVIRKAFDLVHRTQGKRYTLYEIPPDDPATYRMIQRAETVGTFQIESRAQMSMLPRLRPENFYELAVQIGIIRPGPIVGGLINSYLRRKQGTEPITYPDPRLIPILKRTLGIPIFQEQVMRIAMLVGRFSASEADQLRKHIGSWTPSRGFGPLVEKLEQGFRQSGLQEKFIEQMLGHLHGFTNYGFPESHSISFAMIAYASSYLKCHYPAAFYVSLLNSQPMGFYSIHALVQTARREGLHFRPIDINRSEWESTLEEQAPGVWAIRLGFHLVNGLQQAGARRLIERRQRQGFWNSLGPFLQENVAHRTDLTALAAAGALQGFGIDRAAAIWLTEAVPFAPLLDHELPYDFAAEDDQLRMERDFGSFSTTLGQHPALLLRERFWAYELPAEKLETAQQLTQRRDGVTVHAFGLVLVRQAPMTAKGMEFFTLEDETGFINLVFTPQTLALYKHIAHTHAFLCVRGRLQRQGEGHSILVQHVFPRQIKDPKIVSLLERTTSMPVDVAEEMFARLPPARNFH
ncbi:error-prone DNA polymerase [Oligoflexus tunisiensis]|uniref:error-prone DNA polymerase n=1 Tax=Oligoflexus tunisiensis TaxID=708132 RepID=UPI000B097530|nr:error-prone DNA polymerase [Oligoflexus tunisiensis]